MIFVSVGAITNRLRNSASPITTWFGGIGGEPERVAREREHDHDAREAREHHHQRRRDREHREQQDDDDALIRLAVRVLGVGAGAAEVAEVDRDRSGVARSCPRRVVLEVLGVPEIAPGVGDRRRGDRRYGDRARRRDGRRRSGPTAPAGPEPMRHRGDRADEAEREHGADDERRHDPLVGVPLARVFRSRGPCGSVTLSDGRCGPAVARASPSMTESGRPALAVRPSTGPPRSEIDLARDRRRRAS